MTTPDPIAMAVEALENAAGDLRDAGRIPEAREAESALAALRSLQQQRAKPEACPECGSITIHSDWCYRGKAAPAGPGDKEPKTLGDILDAPNDKELLDWLEKHAQWHDPESRLKVVFPVPTVPHTTIRSAIRAAMQQEGREGHLA